jgi:hypothetical protein
MDEGLVHGQNAVLNLQDLRVRSDSCGGCSESCFKLWYFSFILTYRVGKPSQSSGHILRLRGSAGQFHKGFNRDAYDLRFNS